VTDLTVVVCLAIIGATAVTIAVLWFRRPDRALAPSVDETLAELRAATVELTEAATTARRAVERIDRTPPPPPPPSE
jgi:hypothetical protein